MVEFRGTYDATGKPIRVDIVWPDPKPEVVEIEARLLEFIVNQLNRLGEVLLP